MTEFETVNRVCFSQVEAYLLTLRQIDRACVFFGC